MMQIRLSTTLFLLSNFALFSVSESTPPSCFYSYSSPNHQCSSEDDKEHSTGEVYYDYYSKPEDPFLWGDEEGNSEESQTEPYWPGKRQDSFYDYLTR